MAGNELIVDLIEQSDAIDSQDAVALVSVATAAAAELWSFAVLAQA